MFSCFIEVFNAFHYHSTKLEVYALKLTKTFINNGKFDKENIYIYINPQESIVYQNKSFLRVEQK